jgi:hypothetical protein
MILGQFPSVGAPGEPFATPTDVMSPAPIAGLLAMRDQSTFPLSSITMVVPTL